MFVKMVCAALNIFLLVPIRVSHIQPLTKLCISHSFSVAFKSSVLGQVHQKDISGGKESCVSDLLRKFFQEKQVGDYGK